MDTLIKLKDVMKRTSLSRSHIYALIQRKEFPLQVKLSERSVAWIESEVQNWINEKVERRATIKSKN